MPQLLCRLDEIGEHGKEVSVQGENGPVFVMLFRRAKKLHAFHNICPHQCRALNWAPDRFLLSEEGLLVCAHHGAGFDLSTGQCLTGPCVGSTLKPVQISLREREIWLEDLNP
jgi:nitrite reductase/ring-hydroxylating ferredoxin subunit